MKEPAPNPETSAHRVTDYEVPWWSREELERDFPIGSGHTFPEYDLWLLETIATHGRSFVDRMTKEIHRYFAHDGRGDGYLVMEAALERVGELRELDLITVKERGKEGNEDYVLTPLGRRELYDLRSKKERLESSRQQAKMLRIASLTLIVMCLLEAASILIAVLN